jgi:hypothetical protein
MTQVTTTPVSPNRPNYYNVLVCGKPVCEIRFPAPNMPNKTLQEIAEIQVSRILEDYLKAH